MDVILSVNLLFISAKWKIHVSVIYASCNVRISKCEVLHFYILYEIYVSTYHLSFYHIIRIITNMSIYWILLYFMVVYKQSTDVRYASFFLKTLFGANSYEGQCNELLSDENSQISLSLIFFRQIWISTPLQCG